MTENDNPILDEPPSIGDDRDESAEEARGEAATASGESSGQGQDDRATDVEVTAATPQPRRRRYEGRGVSDLRGKRSSVSLPSADDATLLPEPRAGLESLLRVFRDRNGPAPNDERLPFPNLSLRDARALANVLTFALRNDLPQIEPHDAAVIWEKWGNAIKDMRMLTAGVRDDNETDAVSQDVNYAVTILRFRVSTLVDDLTMAIRQPRTVFESYCPWRADWATYERIHPEAV